VFVCEISRVPSEPERIFSQGYIPDDRIQLGPYDGVTTVSARASAGWQPIPARNVDFRPPMRCRKRAASYQSTFWNLFHQVAPIRDPTSCTFLKSPHHGQPI
ncbi:unnamed protein product, partial [Nesidiocoris tenuis]